MTIGTLTHPAKLAEGQLITENGIYDLSMEQYHGQPCDAPSISSSGLRKIWNESPAHFWDECSLNPDRAEPEDKPHFNIGRAAHHLLFLGREGFENEYAVRPECWTDYKKADARAWRDGVLACGMTPLLPSEMDAIVRMASSLGRHPLVKAGILDGYVERSLIFKDPETGIWLKARPDCIPNDSGDFSDLKTTTSVDDDALRRTIADSGYHVQAALVGMAYRTLFKREMQSFSLVFVEKKRPFCVRVVALTDEDIHRGEKQIHASLRLFKQCLEAGEWPAQGNQNDAQYFPLPTWATNRIDARLDVMGV